MHPPQQDMLKGIFLNNKKLFVLPWFRRLEFHQDRPAGSPRACERSRQLHGSSAEELRRFHHRGFLWFAEARAGGISTHGLNTEE